MLCRISDRILAETLAISTSFLAATFSAPLAFSKSPKCSSPSSCSASHS